MIRIVLHGRTGNIFFQYALGRVLSEKYGVPLVLDASWYNGEGWREVSHFLKLPIKAKVVRPCAPFSLASRALRKWRGKHQWEYLYRNFLKERGDDHTFDSRFLKAPANCVLSGYFQSPLYFTEIASALRDELRHLLAGTSQPVPEVIAMLIDPRSVAVHVRRGDFLNDPIFQVCDLRYYAKSMEEMRTRVPGARFFIFSDDPGWCRSEFTGSDIHVLGAETEARNPLHDLRLMSTASHHIIANSSYSWWAAWLGDKPGQEVIMPDRWFTTGINAPVSEKRWK